MNTQKKNNYYKNKSNTNNNKHNYGVACGNLTKDPQFFRCKNGNTGVALTVAVNDNFRKKNGDPSAQFIRLYAFIPGNHSNHGIYDQMKKGMKITAEYSVKSYTCTDSDGKFHFEQSLNIHNISLANTENKPKNDASNSNTKPVPRDNHRVDPF